MSLLQVKNLTYAFQKGKPVFSDLSFTSESGSITAVIGPNGVGKTTLLRTILGFLKKQNGEVLWDGKDLTILSEKARFEKISYVPQNQKNRIHFTVEEMILMGLTGSFPMFHVPNEKEIGEVEKTLERLSIQHLKGKYVDELSGGEAQMTLIARALIKNPSLLILDEPESGLDFRNQLIILETLQKLAKDGVAVLFNTHYPDHALKIADRVLLMGESRAFFGKTNEVLTEKNIEEVFHIQSKLIETDGLKTVIPVKRS